jgi:serine/threonine-protein kinase
MSGRGIGKTSDRVRNRLNGDPADAATLAEVPQRIGRFKIVEEIARGGMGIVYKAIDPDNGKVVAIKRIRSDRTGSAGEASRFLEEAQRMAQFDHPNILKVLEVGEDNGRPYYVMNYVNGGSLDDYVADTRGGVETILGAVYKIALALQQIHEKGWLHRDVKPSNILVGRDGEPYLSDFGIARLLSHEHEEDNDDETAGTPMYMAPEQLLAPSIVDERTDVYALGVIMYELMTGVRPYRGHGTEVVISRILFWDPIQPRMLNPAIPTAVETVVMKAMEKRTSHRYRTAGDLAHDLKALLVRVAINRRLHRHETAVDLPAVKRN